MANTHSRHVGDTRTFLSATLAQPNSAGVVAAINLLGCTVTFKMINSATGVTKIAATATGVTIVDSLLGHVQYQFAADGVDVAGIFWGAFVTATGGSTDHFPVVPSELEIHFNSDKQTAADAYNDAK